MAYEKQTWANGDLITAEKLNHMEDGIAGVTSGNRIYTVGSNISSGADVAKADMAIPEGMNPVVNDLILDSAGDMYRITAVSADKVHVSDALSVNLKGPKGDTGATGAKGDKGDKGDTGATGPKGADGKSVTEQAAQADLAADANTAAIVAGFNSLLAKLRLANVISSN